MDHLIAASSGEDKPSEQISIFRQLPPISRALRMQEWDTWHSAARGTAPIWSALTHGAAQDPPHISSQWPFPWGSPPLPG